MCRRVYPILLDAMHRRHVGREMENLQVQHQSAAWVVVQLVRQLAVVEQLVVRQQPLA